MARLDFEKLIEPYADKADGVAKRTPEGQRAWLAKKSMSPEVVDGAMQVVYARLARGKKFDSGHLLDRYLLHECEKQSLAREKALTRVQQTNLNRALSAAQPFSWPAAVSWFILGSMLGVFVGQWL